MVLISHDRHLLANSVDEFLLVNRGEVEVFTGDLTDYRQHLARKVDPEPAALPVRARTNHRESGQLRTRLNTIESRLGRLQTKLSEVETALASSALYGRDEQADLQRLLREQLGLREEILILEEDWLTKSEALENIDK